MHVPKTSTPTSSTTDPVTRVRRASPIVYLSHASKRALYLIGILSAVKGLALVFLAQSVATGIVSTIDQTVAWQSAMLLGVFAGVLRGAAAWGTEVVATRAALGAKADIRQRLATRMVARGGHDLDRDSGVGATTSLATTGLDALDSWFSGYLPALVSSVTIPLIVGARILRADWVSALVIVLTVPLIPIFMILIGSHTQERVGAAADSLARLSDHLVELARGLPVLVGLGRAEEQTKTLRAVSERYRQRTMQTLRVAFLSSLALELIATISVAVVAVFIGVRLVHGNMDLETGLLALLLAPECFLPLREIGAAHHASEDGVEAMQRAELTIDTPLSLLATTDVLAAMNAASTEVGGSAAKHDVSTAKGMRVENLTVQFASRSLPAMSNLSFNAAPGQIVALVGPSGCGKSTALAAIAGLLGTTTSDDSSGVRVEGSITGVSADRVAWVPQHPATYAETVRDEISLYSNNAGNETIEAILAQVGATHLRDRHPGELSPGELRRVAVGRALARIDAGASLLLLDEPTAHLDTETAETITRVITDVRATGKVTILLVAHDTRLRDLADLVVPVGVQIETAPTTTTDFFANRRDPIEPSTAAPTAERAWTPPSGTKCTEGLEIREILRDLIRILQPWRPTFLAAFLFGTLAALFAIALTSVSGWLIVRASQQPPILYLLVAIVGVRFFGVGRALFRYAERLWLHDAIFASLTDLRVRVWEFLAAQGPSVARQLRGERALDHLIGDIDRVRDLAPRVVLPPIVGAATALFTTVALGLMLPGAALAMTVCAIVCLVAAPTIALWADRSARTGGILIQSQVLRKLAALFGAAPDLHVNGVDSGVLQELADLDREASGRARRSAWALGLGHATVILGCVSTAMVMMWLSARAIGDGAITPQIAAVLILTPLALIDPFVAVTEAVQQWPALQTVLGRFQGQLDQESVPNVHPNTQPTEREENPISRVNGLAVEDLTARWPGDSAPVFTGLTVSLTTSVTSGTWLAVTGPSGSGKSTLLTVLLAFLRPSAGTYRLNNRDTASMSGTQIRAHIAWCPQEAHLFDSSLRTNLLIARSREDAPTEAELVAALEQVGLGELFAELPEGLDTTIGAQGSHLSGGQRTRLAIARTLLTDADVLLIDEPTAHLDRESATSLMADLREGLTGKIVVLVTHHVEDLRPGDTNVTLRDGRAALHVHTAHA